MRMFYGGDPLQVLPIKGPFFLVDCRPLWYLDFTPGQFPTGASLLTVPLPALMFLYISHFILAVLL